ncbi:hypothetical protein PC39_13957 [Salinisphaera sp. PC39]|uniref:hypothetical protein n=1 Tax=Salinisphaera sp. PC39 TaxID=1304156 RepID=UPI0033406D15
MTPSDNQVRERIWLKTLVALATVPVLATAAAVWAGSELAELAASLQDAEDAEDAEDAQADSADRDGL